MSEYHGVTGRRAVSLVARREIATRGREKGFLISTGVSLAIVALIVVLPQLLGFGGTETYNVGVTNRAAVPVAEAAQRGAKAFDAEIDWHQVTPAQGASQLASGDLDAVLDGRRIRAQEEPDDALINALQAADREVRVAAALQRAGVQGQGLRDVLNAPALAVSTVEAVDEERDRKGNFAFVAVIFLYGQLLTFGYLVASGVVEEKSSRVVEILLSSLRPRELLAGKVIGLGLLGLAQLLVIAVVGLGLAAALGALDVDEDILVAAALALAWFVLGYAFYSCAFACAGALVPRQEELQSATLPLTLVILVSFFLSFAVLDDPNGTLAVVTSFLPFSAPMTMPPRIALGEVPAWQVIVAILVTAGSAIALIPLAGRIYSGAVLRTGSAIKLRDAWRAARS
jgi:ABC-2 type transport system permease protein